MPFQGFVRAPCAASRPSAVAVWLAFFLALQALPILPAVKAQGAGDFAAFGERKMRLGGPGPSLEAADQAHSDRAHSYRGELIANRLLGSARTDIEEARPEVAQRVLEMLVARFPETNAARDARGLLIALDSANRPAGAGMETSGLRVGGVAVPHAIATGEKDRQPGEVVLPLAAPVSSWRTSIISHRRHQDELRDRIGDRLFFSAGSAELGSRARKLIAAQAEWLLRNPDLVVIVEGHADDLSAGAPSEPMSASRASVVRDRLVAEGVPAERVRISAMGDRDPVAICGDSDCAAQNRRAVVLVGMRAGHDSGIGNSVALPSVTARDADQRR